MPDVSPIDAVSANSPPARESMRGNDTCTLPPNQLPLPTDCGVEISYCGLTRTAPRTRSESGSRPLIEERNLPTSPGTKSIGSIAPLVVVGGTFSSEMSWP